jgi:hypothetical protein
VLVALHAAVERRHKTHSFASGADVPSLALLSLPLISSEFISKAHNNEVKERIEEFFFFHHPFFFLFCGCVKQRRGGGVPSLQ